MMVIRAVLLGFLAAHAAALTAPRPLRLHAGAAAAAATGRRGAMVAPGLRPSTSMAVEVLQPSYDLAIGCLALSSTFIPGSGGSLATGPGNPKLAKIFFGVVGVPVALFGLFIAFQTTTLRFTLDDTQFALVKQDLSTTGENVVVGGENRWAYDKFVNYGTADCQGPANPPPPPNHTSLATSPASPPPTTTPHHPRPHRRRHQTTTPPHHHPRLLPELRLPHIDLFQGDPDPAGPVDGRARRAGQLGRRDRQRRQTGAGTLLPCHRQRQAAEGGVREPRVRQAVVGLRCTEQRRAGAWGGPFVAFDCISVPGVLSGRGSLLLIKLRRGTFMCPEPHEPSRI